MRTVIKHHLLDLIWVGTSEWILNMVTLWIRPIYRRMIKTEKGKRLAFKLGNIQCVGKLLCDFCMYSHYIFGIVGVGVGFLPYVLYGDIKLTSILSLVVIAIFLLGYVFIMVIFCGLWRSYGWVDIQTGLGNQDEVCLWFSNPEDFCKYHDGYFRKEKLIHRMWLQLDEKSK